jgi:hypothetical protein
MLKGSEAFEFSGFLASQLYRLPASTYDLSALSYELISICPTPET